MIVQAQRLGRHCSVFGSVVVLFFIGCASAPEQTNPNPTAQHLIGKSQAQILQCAGQPAKQMSSGEGVILRYYKEAPTFAGSPHFSEGSQRMIFHHGCWASLLIEKNQVTGVEFRTVPEEAEKADYECEEIFRQCEP